MNCCENRTESKNKAAHIDPVCGMAVDDANLDLAAEYRGRKYYFCAEACRQKFKRQPECWLDPERTTGSKKKGLWGRYLDRLNKATGGKEIKCH